MAQVELRYFGAITGKLGNVVFRNVNGKTIVSKAPASHKKPVTIEEKKRRTRFGLAVRFAVVALRLEGLKEIWRSLYPTKRIYNLLVSLNCNSAEEADIKRCAIISPEGGFAVVHDAALLAEDFLGINFLPLEESCGINTETEKFIRLAAVVFLAKPLVRELPEYHIFHIDSDNIAFNSDESFTLGTLLTETAACLVKSYGIQKIFGTLITLDSDNTPVQASRTFCLEFLNGVK